MTVAAERVSVRRRRGALVRSLRFARSHLLTVYAMLAFAYLLLPIAVVVAFSFNHPAGKFNIVWQGFTLENWLHPFDVPDIQEAVQVSIEIALLSSIFATALGTFIALALVRYRFRGSGATNLLIFLPMVTLPLIAPGILAAALLSFALSVDDFVITYLNSGSVVTFPLYVWGAARTEIAPQINVIGSAIFFIAVVLMLANILLQWRRQPKGAV
jgi:ABC-type spermidine/putrescine transport system permease subunit II